MRWLSSFAVKIVKIVGGVTLLYAVGRVWWLLSPAPNEYLFYPIQGLLSFWWPMHSDHFPYVDVDFGGWAGVVVQTMLFSVSTFVVTTPIVSYCQTGSRWGLAAGIFAAAYWVSMMIIFFTGLSEVGMRIVMAAYWAPPIIIVFTVAQTIAHIRGPNQSRQATVAPPRS